MVALFIIFPPRTTHACCKLALCTVRLTGAGAWSSSGGELKTRARGDKATSFHGFSSSGPRGEGEGSRPVRDSCGGGAPLQMSTYWMGQLRIEASSLSGTKLPSHWMGLLRIEASSLSGTKRVLMSQMPLVETVKRSGSLVKACRWER